MADNKMVAAGYSTRFLKT